MLGLALGVGIGMGSGIPAAPSPVVSLDFINGVYQCGATQYASWDSFLSGTGATFTRASAQNYTASNGAVTAFSSGNAAIGDLGLLYEAAGTNGIRNSNMTGAAATNTIATNWTTTNVGVTRTIAVGTDATTGLPYMDIRFQGTTGSTSFTIQMEANTQIAALTDETWTVSGWLALVAGSFTNVSTVRFSQVEYNSGGTQVSNHNGSSLIGSLTSTPQRFSSPILFSGGATTAFNSPRVTGQWSNGAAVDLTLRFIGVQAEKAAAASSYITTSAGAANRAACALTLPLPTGTWNLTATFDDNSTQALNGVSGSYLVPANLNRGLIKTITGVAA